MFKFTLLVFLICLSNILNAQIKDSPVLFYAREDSRVVIIMQFKNFEHYRCWGNNANKETVIQNLKRNINFYEELFATNSGGVKRTDPNACPSYNGYDGYGELKYSDMSNELWYVYERFFPPASDGMWTAHTQYNAIKKDFSEYMYWWEFLDKPNETPKVVKLPRVTKQQLLEIKAVRPFLNN
ncbi:MAG: hypothetical protein IKO99_03600 [Bacteroidales bacterium]|nr:hypothetical protein [Alphaproteobacteria bacterium]MBR4677069.1 hypothetical protein [Bacteroidales bacterium]